MNKLIIELASLWQNYYKLKHVDSSQRADRLINIELKEALSEINKSFGFENLLVGSSSGEGNITRGPWLASYDRRITETATQGFYVVFLFSTNMKTLTLELGLGATQFTKFYGKNKKALSEIRNAANRMQLHALANINNSSVKNLTDRVVLGPSSVTDKKGYSLQRGYEEGAILHLTYSIDENLDIKSLIGDYADFIKIYQMMVEDELVPNNEELLSSSIEPTELIKKISKAEIIDFVPRTKTKNSKRPISKSFSRKKTPSFNTKEIGDWGEIFVLEQEIEYLQENGRADLAQKVIHEEAQNNRPGWDITSFDLNGNIRRIEVKSTVSNAINNLNFTANELKAATTFGDAYFLYLLTGINSKGAKKVEVLKNPVALIDSGTIQIRPTLYEIKLFSSDDN